MTACAAAPLTRERAPRDGGRGGAACGGRCRRADLVDVDAGRAPVGEQRLTRPAHHLERPHPGGERHPPRVVGAVVAPRHAVVGRFGHEAVPGEQPRPRRVGAGRHVVGPVGDVRQAELLEHVGADAVGAEHHRVRAGRRTGVADAVVHVAARVVGDRARQVTIEQHAVHEQPIVACEVGQPGAGVGVGRALGDVHVHADAEVSGQSRGRGQRVVGARERGVHADHPPPTGADEALVLGQPAAGAVGPVAVGDAVRTHHGHADLGARLGDHVEAALDRVRALVMVDDAGGAAHQRLGGAEAGARPDHVEVEGGVEAPPHLLEDRCEVGGRGRRGRHPARQRRVQVVVGADETGRGGAHGERTAQNSRTAVVIVRATRRQPRSVQCGLRGRGTRSSCGRCARTGSRSTARRWRRRSAPASARPRSASPPGAPRRCRRGPPRRWRPSWS